MCVGDLEVCPSQFSPIKGVSRGPISCWCFHPLMFLILNYALISYYQTGLLRRRRKRGTSCTSSRATGTHLPSTRRQLVGSFCYCTFQLFWLPSGKVSLPICKKSNCQLSVFSLFLLSLFVVNKERRTTNKSARVVWKPPRDWLLHYEMRPLQWQNTHTGSF